MSHVIEYCHCNRDLEADLSNVDDDIQLEGQLCLEHCGICRTQDFVVIDGRVMIGEDILETLDGGEF